MGTCTLIVLYGRQLALYNMLNIKDIQFKTNFRTDKLSVNKIFTRGELNKKISSFAYDHGDVSSGLVPTPHGSQSPNATRITKAMGYDQDSGA
jgi:hypothetical protein